MHRINRVIGGLLQGLVRLYQHVGSLKMGPVCRFYPSCSEYMVLSIQKKGPFLGVLCGLKRILRCHPFYQGGVDYPR